MKVVLTATGSVASPGAGCRRNRGWTGLRIARGRPARNQVIDQREPPPRSSARPLVAVGLPAGERRDRLARSGRSREPATGTKPARRALDGRRPRSRARERRLYAPGVDRRRRVRSRGAATASVVWTICCPGWRLMRRCRCNPSVRRVGVAPVWPSAARPNSC